MFLRLHALKLVAALALLGCGDAGEATPGGGTSSTPGAGGGGAGGANADGGAPAVGGGGGGQGGNGGRAAEEPCLLVEPTCPGAPPASAGQGLAAIDRCAFSLQKTDFESLAPLVESLATVATQVTLGDVLGDLNRSAVAIAPSAVPGDPAGVSLAFRWEDEENDKATWVPQGLTGSPDADASGIVEGRRLAVVSFYWDEGAAAPGDSAKGVRLALVDITDPADPQYRFILLVEPKAGPDWDIVDIHAGGIAWFGDYLYVASTGSGLRVFDLRQIFQADTSEDVIGCDATSCKAGLYKYVLPQVGRYQRVTPCGAPPIFSFVALDRSLSPPALVTGEYCSDTACDGPLNGRIFRYSLDPTSGLLAADQTFARDAFYMGERQVQGGVSIGDTFFLSSSAPAGGAGDLYRVTTNGSSTFGWVDTPEDLMVDGSSESIFSLSEGIGERVVFEAGLASYLP